jgi:hypothetical protein
MALCSTFSVGLSDGAPVFAVAALSNEDEDAFSAGKEGMPSVVESGVSLTALASDSDSLASFSCRYTNKNRTLQSTSLIWHNNIP